MDTRTVARRTRIIATLGPATDPPDVLEGVLAAGVDVVRLNFSHGDPSQHAARAARVRSIAHRLGREVGVLADLGGPKIRVERFAEGAVVLRAGEPFTLDCRADAPRAMQGAWASATWAWSTTSPRATCCCSTTG